MVAGGGKHCAVNLAVCGAEAREPPAAAAEAAAAEAAAAGTPSTTARKPQSAKQPAEQRPAAQQCCAKPGNGKSATRFDEHDRRESPAECASRIGAAEFQSQSAAECGQFTGKATAVSGSEPERKAKL